MEDGASTNLRASDKQLTDTRETQNIAEGGVAGGCYLCNDFDDDWGATENVAMERSLVEKIQQTDVHREWVDAFCGALNDSPHPVFNGAYDCNIELFDCMQKRWEDEAMELLEKVNALDAAMVEDLEGPAFYTF